MCNVCRHDVQATNDKRLDVHDFDECGFTVQRRFHDTLRSVLHLAFPGTHGKKNTQRSLLRLRHVGRGLTIGNMMMLSTIIAKLAPLGSFVSVMQRFVRSSGINMDQRPLQ